MRVPPRRPVPMIYCSWQEFQEQQCVDTRLHFKKLRSCTLFTCRMIFPKAKYTPLLTADDCKFLADIVAVSWDLRNNGMTRAEITTNSDGIGTMRLKTASHKPIWLPCTQLQEAIWIDHFLSDMMKWWCCSGNKIKPLQLQSTQELSLSWCKSFQCAEGDFHEGWEACAKSWHAWVHHVFVASAIPITSTKFGACWMWVCNSQLRLQELILQE